MKKLHRTDLLIFSILLAGACLFTLVAQAANAKPTEYQGRSCLMLDGGAATVKGLELRDGVVDVDVFTPASRGFFGIQFRMQDEGANGEWVYLRQHKSAQDAMQGGGWGFIARWRAPVQTPAGLPCGSATHRRPVQ